MATKFSSRDFVRCLGGLALMATLLIACSWRAQACPFCNAVLPSFSQEAAIADVVALGEVEQGTASDAFLNVRLRQVLQGKDLVQVDQQVQVPRVEALSAGSLCLLLGSEILDEADSTDATTEGADKPSLQFEWTYRPVTETSYAYFARAPRRDVSAPKRLRYFAKYLQHPDASIAADAYLEFGHAPFDLVAEAADALPLDKCRLWLVDDDVPQERKGFYGLALGLAPDAKTKNANAEFLRGLILTPADDFRAGFGGILSGYLLAAGAPGLDFLDERYLANPQAADGDVRSALSALRFYHEYGQEIPVERQQKSLRRVLSRTEFAAEAIVDLARWQDWDAVDEAVELYRGPERFQPTLRRAVVGYLSTAPTPAAATALQQLRAADPRGVTDAETYLKSFGTVR